MMGNLKRASEPSLVAVLMPAFNPGSGLDLTLRSIASSTMPVDVFVVDDGSDPAVNIPTESNNVFLIRLDKNVGIAGALNAGLLEILRRQYQYIARMDVGDVARQDRFQRQLRFLSDNPQCVIVGSWVRVIDEHTRSPLYHLNFPISDPDIRKHLYFNQCMTHVAWMFRASAVLEVGLYSEGHLACEDYELLRRLGQCGAYGNLPEYLVDCEYGENGISVRKRRNQLVNRLRVQLSHFRPIEWRWWAGVAKTLLLLLAPVRLLSLIKRQLPSFRPAQNV
jgi:GT2 family glycosyltransferase